MAQRSGFFQDDAGDRVYTADEFANHYRQFLLNGVFVKNSTNLTTELEVTANDTDMDVSINLGSANVQGYFYEVYTSAETLTLDNGDALNPRIDRIVVRVDLQEDARVATVEILKGAPSATPTPLSLTQTVEVWEESLAQILVPQNATLVLDSNVTDERTNVELQVKTAELTDKDVVLISQVFS